MPHFFYISFCPSKSQLFLNCTQSGWAYLIMENDILKIGIIIYNIFIRTEKEKQNESK